MSMQTLKCHECGDNLILIADGNRGHWIACLTCRAFNDAKKVLEHEAGLIGGSLTPEEAVNLRKQIRASGKNLN